MIHVQLINSTVGNDAVYAVFGGFDSYKQRLGEVIADALKLVKKIDVDVAVDLVFYDPSTDDAARLDVAVGVTINPRRSWSTSVTFSMWDRSRIEALIDDFLDQAFGKQSRRLQARSSAMIFD